MCGYHHLSIGQREKLFKYSVEGYSQKLIASLIGCSQSSVSRELSRNRGLDGEYSPSASQIHYEENRKKSVRKKVLESDEELRHDVHFLLCYLYWSPEQISNRFREENRGKGIGTSTIYRAFTNGALRDTMIYYLRIKHKRIGKAKKPKRSFITKTIYERPEAANNRERIGDWECDTVAGYCENYCVFTFVDRKSRYLLAAVSPTKEAAQFKRAALEQFCNIPKEHRISFTGDRGTELALMAEIEKELEITAYFADPHAPWQKGTVENTNGLLRQFLPKRTKFDSLTQVTLNSMVAKLNNRPRKVLKWRTPYEVFTNQFMHFT